MREDHARLDGIRIEARAALAMLCRLRNSFAEDARPALSVEIAHYRNRIRQVENLLHTRSKNRMTNPVRGWAKAWRCEVSDWLRSVEDDERRKAKGEAA